MDARNNKLHPDAAARDSRKRSLDGPDDEKKVPRERSASRHEEATKHGIVARVLLQRKNREKEMTDAGKRVHRPARFRGSRGFCHPCEKEQLFRNMRCTECGHERCFQCQVAMKDG